MEVSTETSSTNNISVEISLNGQKLERVTSFKYLDWSNLVQGWHLLSRNLNQDCFNNGQTKQDLAVLYHQFHKQVQGVRVSCHLHPPLTVKHGPCLLILKRFQAFEIKCIRKPLCISYLEHETNYWLWSKIHFLVGP